MNKRQKKVAIIYGIVIFVMTFLLMPWSISAGTSGKFFQGFSPIWVKPVGNASPDILILLMEIIVISIIACILFLIFKGGEKE